MDKHPFGIASHLKGSVKIYYENLFSQFQMGRVVDLLCSIATTSGTSPSYFRSSLHSLLNEACLNQAPLDQSKKALDPVTVEYGADDEKCVVGVSFTFAEEQKEFFASLPEEVKKSERKLDLIRNLDFVAAFAGRLLIKVNPASQRVEIVVVLFHRAQKSSCALECVLTHAVSPLSKDPHDYTSLGDVDYAKLIQENALSGEQGKRIEERIAQEVDQLLSDQLSSKESFEVISKFLGPTKLAETIERNLSSEELGKLLASAETEKVAQLLTEELPEEELKKIVTESISEEDKAKVLAEADPQKCAKILKKTLTEEEIKTVFKENLTDDAKAKVLMTADAEASAEILKSVMTREEISEVLQESLPEEVQGKILADSLSKKEVAQVLKENLAPSKKAEMLAAANPSGTAKALRSQLAQEEVNELIREDLPDEEKAKVLAQELSSTEVAELVSQNLTVQDKAKLLAKLDPKKSLEMIRETTRDEDLAQTLFEELTPEELAEAVKEALTPKELGEILSKNISKEQAKVVVQGLSNKEAARLLKDAFTEEELTEAIQNDFAEEELAQLIKDSLPKDEQAQLVKGVLSPEDQAKLLRDQMSEEELVQVVKGGLTPDEIAKAVISGTSPEDTSRIILSSMSQEEARECLVSSLAQGEVAAVVAQGMPPHELAQLAKSTLSADQFAETISAHLPADKLAQIAHEALDDPEISGKIIKILPPEELAKSLAGALPAEKLKALAQTHLEDHEIMETLSRGLTREELAKLLTSILPRESYSAILTEGLPPQEIARALSDGLPREKFAQLLAVAVPTPTIAASLAEFKGDLNSNFRPTQSVLEMDQIQQLMSPGLRQSEAISTLSSILPKAVAEGILSGSIPPSDVEKMLVSHLPTPEIAPLLSKRLAENQLASVSSTQRSSSPHPSGSPAEQRAVESSPEKQVKGGQTKEAQIKVVSGKTDGAHKAPVQAEQSKTASPKEAQPNEPPNFAKERQRLTAAFESRIATVKKTVEFYLKRSRDLETQLRNAEEAKRKAQQENNSSRIQLEKVLAEQLVSEPSKIQTSNSDESKLTVKGAPEKALEVAVVKEKTPSQDLRSITPREVRSLAQKDSNQNIKLEGKVSRESSQPLGVGSAPSSARSGLSPSPEGPSSADTASDKVIPASSTPQSEQLAKREKEASQFFQKKAKELESELRAAEAEIKKLKEDRAKDLIKQSQEKSVSPKVSERRTQSLQPEHSVKEKVVVKEKSVPEQGLQEKIRELEKKLQHAENEKEKWRLQFSENQRSALKSNTTLVREKGQDVLDVSVARVEEKKKDVHDLTEIKIKEPEDKVAPEVQPEDLGQQQEKTAEAVSSGFDRVYKKLENVKESIPEDRIKNVISSLMSEVFQDKAKLAKMTKDITESLRKKELSFKSRESMLVEDLKREKALSNQKQAKFERMNQFIQEMQQNIEKSKAIVTQSQANESQIKVKYEQSQRQIEAMTREIERMNRKAQLAPSSQSSNSPSSHQFGQSELNRQVETINKALIAKKQELELLKRQINEKDVKETEYRRTIMRLQKELNAVKSAPKKAG